MATNWNICGVCHNLHITKQSVEWCSECDEGLCEKCKEHHAVSKSSKSHETVSISEYKKLPTKVLEIAQTCKLHNEKFELFCKKHDCPCCKKCVESHNDCKSLIDINELIKNIKTSNAFYEFEQNLLEIVENIKRLNTHRKENLTSLEDKKRKIETKIAQTRTNFNIHLDKLQDGLIKELTAIEEKEKRKIQTLLTFLKDKKKNINEFQENIASIKKHASELQTFLAMKHIEKDIDVEEKIIQSITKTDTTNQVNISCQINESLKQIIDSVHKFGEIYVTSYPCDFSIQKRKERQAQIMVSLPTRNIENLILSLDKRINTKLSNVRGCSILPDSMTVYKDGHLIYCAREKGLQMISLSDESITNITYNKLSIFAYVTAFGDRLFYTNYDHDSEICCDYHGKILWTFHDTTFLLSPLGISVDNDGFVYVVGGDTHNVVVISPDGKHCRKILSSDDGLNLPHVLHYDQSTNKLLVANHLDTAFLFDVKR
ncbi:uncharacterized protein LOC134687783 [Mytilus trossulus]|uniref:uncharacterized protein LOC134687783 n=1 Tax=Mytilus trossulus TaxID=6551 RepID=UPI003005C5F0